MTVSRKVLELLTSLIDPESVRSARRAPRPPRGEPLESRASLSTLALGTTNIATATHRAGPAVISVSQPASFTVAYHANHGGIAGIAGGLVGADDVNDQIDEETDPPPGP